MLLFVADTSPVRYLVQIGQIDLLARLFEEIKLPSIVAEELRHPSAPAVVRAWMEGLPEWVEVLTAPENDDPVLGKLDPGERAAIALGFVSLRDALDRLTRTNFRYRPELIAALLAKHRD